MYQAVMLDEVDWARFSSAVESSFDVGNRHQFFVWSQSVVQGIVPHQILLCGIRDTSSHAMRVEHFSASRYFRQEHVNALIDPRSGLLRRLQSVYECSGESVSFSPCAVPQAVAEPLDSLVANNEMQNLAAMLIHGVDGQIVAFYGFARVPVDFGARLRRLIELMVPHLHSTFVRVMTNERETSAFAEPRSDRVITTRQTEILMLIKDGKTNAEIATLLDCSQWTVKNHIQNILRRLKTNSRAHALVVAMRMGILRPD